MANADLEHAWVQVSMVRRAGDANVLATLTYMALPVQSDIQHWQGVLVS